ARAAHAAPRDTSRFAGRSWIKFAIQKTGFYAVNFSRVRQSSLFGAGSSVPFDGLRLFTWPGRTVLPEDSYCDTCDYRDVALGIVRDVGPPSAGVDGPADGKFSDNRDAIYFFAQGPDGWESDMDDSRPDTSFIDHPYDSNNFYYLTVATRDFPVSDTSYPVPPQRIGADASSLRSVRPDGSETPVATVAGRLHLEEDHEYWPDATAIGTTLVW